MNWLAVVLVVLDFQHVDFLALDVGAVWCVVATARSRCSGDEVGVFAEVGGDDDLDFFDGGGDKIAGGGFAFAFGPLRGQAKAWGASFDRLLTLIRRSLSTLMALKRAGPVVMTLVPLHAEVSQGTCVVQCDVVGQPVSDSVKWGDKVVGFKERRQFAGTDSR